MTKCMTMLPHAKQQGERWYDEDTSELNALLLSRLFALPKRNKEKEGRVQGARSASCFFCAPAPFARRLSLRVAGHTSPLVLPMPHWGSSFRFDWIFWFCAAAAELVHRCAVRSHGASHSSVARVCLDLISFAFRPLPFLVSSGRHRRLAFFVSAAFRIYSLFGGGGGWEGVV